MALLFRQMTVCGVGLIGGSLAMVARRKKLVEKIIGFGRRQANLDVALERKLIDFATRDPVEAARGADLLLLAVPITTMPALLREMAPHLPVRTVISDVGSVKSWVVNQLEPLLGPEMALIAAHPVAGKETTGAQAADWKLFRGRRVIITPGARATDDALARIEKLWRAAGARVECMAPELHDQLLARSSHLPQIVSSALAASLVDDYVGGRLAADYGAGGLADTTRLAMSSAEIWRDICLTNRDAILAALRRYRATFAEFERAIEGADPAALEKIFNRGRMMREQVARRKGPIVAIDGPVGAGKSTVAQELARQLGLSHINTGAMYRAVALAARDAGIECEGPDLEARIAPLLHSLQIAFDGERVIVNGRDVTEPLSSPEIGDLASRFSTLASVRERMRQLQRMLGAAGNIVMEGRDIGTAVFPDADFKFYLDADAEVRAQRRFAELKAKRADVSRQEVLAQLLERDRRDRNRELAPLKCAPDAIVIDSSRLTIPRVVERIKDHIKGSGPRRRGT